MPTPADWLLVSEFLDAAFEPTLAESQALYAKLDTNRQEQLTYAKLKAPCL